MTVSIGLRAGGMILALKIARSGALGQVYDDWVLGLLRDLGVRSAFFLDTPELGVK